MRSGIGARILLSIGFLAAMVSLDSWIATRTVMDTAATRGMAGALLANPVVQRSLGDQVAKQVDQQLGAARNDPRIKAASAQAVRDPRVRRAFSDALARAHAALLGDGKRVVVINSRVLTGAVHDALATRDPKAAAELARQKPLNVKLDLSKAPSLGHARDVARNAIWMALVAALLLVGGSLLLAHDRRAIRRLGRRIAYLAIGPLLIFEALPIFLESRTGDGPAVAAVVVRSYSSQVLPFAIALVVAGIVVVLGSFVGRRRAPNPASPSPGEPFRPEPVSPYRAAFPPPPALPVPDEERLYL
jgi:hypothetical protein